MTRQVWFLGNGSIELRDGPVPVPGPDEVVVRVVYSALCGSELGAYRGSSVMLNPGHEAVGVVEAIGTECKRLAPGDRVGVCAVQGCGACAYCQAGQNTYCEARTGVMGMHGTHIVSRERGCRMLPDDISWQAGVLLSGDGLGVPYHVSRRLGETRGRTVAVLGAGPVGLGNVLMQAHLGATVAAFDLSERRLELAQGLGAKSVGQPSGPSPDELARLVVDRMGGRPDVVVECVGREPTLRAALSAVAPGGTVVCVGEQSSYPLDPSNELIRRDITLMGSWFFHLSELDGMVSAERAGLGVERLITHTFPLESAAEAYEQFAAGLTGKVLIAAGES
jgi:threonine dehydrogenase-like Zn-dependent dehydrogenase